MLHQSKKRGGRAPSVEEMDTCLRNAAPGTPDLSVLSFQGGFHGRLFGSLTCTRSKAIHKLDIPAFREWPAAPFPKLRYPLAEYAAENAAEEARCLQAVEQLLKTAKAPVAAMIIEPIQAEGGGNCCLNPFETF